MIGDTYCSLGRRVHRFSGISGTRRVGPFDERATFTVLLLTVHIIDGSIALRSVAITLASKKGGGQHKFFGK